MTSFFSSHCNRPLNFTYAITGLKIAGATKTKTTKTKTKQRKITKKFEMAALRRNVCSALLEANFNKVIDDEEFLLLWKLNEPKNIDISAPVAVPFA